jgi:hypothetical protein
MRVLFDVPADVKQCLDKNSIVYNDTAVFAVTVFIEDDREDTPDIGIHQILYLPQQGG